ncbi:hypothetical protein GCM10028794_22920 [Silanimonas algicola]
MYGIRPVDSNACRTGEAEVATGTFFNEVACAAPAMATKAEDTAIEHHFCCKRRMVDSPTKRFR